MNGIRKAILGLCVLLLAVPAFNAWGAKLKPADEIKCIWEPVGPGGGGGHVFPNF